jgi:hypothetical protein
VKAGAPVRLATIQECTPKAPRRPNAGAAKTWTTGSLTFAGSGDRPLGVSAASLHDTAGGE